LSQSVIVDHSFLRERFVLDAPLTDPMGHQLFGDNPSTRGTAKARHGLIEKALHRPADQAQKMGMVAGAGSVLEHLDAVSPHPIRSPHAMHQPVLFQTGQSPIQGHPIDVHGCELIGQLCV